MATVMLDAGHGGFDNGAMFNGRKEKDDNLSLTLKVGQELEDRGVNVIYTRTEDIYQSPNQKAGIANRSDADYFVSFHRNSSPMLDTYSGIQTIVYSAEGIPLVMAQNINKELVNVGFKDLGIIERPNLAVLRGTRMPAVLIETGFINTDADNRLFDEKNDEIAGGIADAIVRTVSGAAGTGVSMMSESKTAIALNRNKTAVKDETAVGFKAEKDRADSGTAADLSSVSERFSVQMGLFRHYENADKLAKNVQKLGFDCFVEKSGRLYSVCHGRYEKYADARAAEDNLFKNGFETRIVISAGISVGINVKV